MGLLYPLPETQTDLARALVVEHLQRPESFPQVQHAPMEDARNRQHAKQERRKYTGERITAMGDLS